MKTNNVEPNIAKVSPDDRQRADSDFCSSLLVDACGCRDDAGGYFESDGSTCYDVSCGCINFR